jgi:hypothetical protein
MGKDLPECRAPLSVGLFDELVKAGRQLCATSSGIHGHPNAQGHVYCQSQNTFFIVKRRFNLF